MTARIVIATPHARYAGMIERLQARPEMELLPVGSREELSATTITQFGPDFLFFPHWSWKIPAEVYEQFETIIFHMTDLPYGRGGSPLQNLIRLGHKRTRLTALRCVEVLDAGPIYLQRDLSLDGTAEEIFARAALLMEEMIVEIVARRPQPQAQEGKIVTFKRLKPADGDLAKATSLEQAYDMIRMLDADGYPSAFLTAGGLRLEFSSAAQGAEAIDAKVVIRRSDDA